MPQTITCPNCHRRLQLPESLGGQMVVCPACRVSFQAGTISVAAPVAPVPPVAIPVSRVEEVPLLPEWEKSSSPPPAQPAGNNPWAEIAREDASKPRTPPSGLRRPEIKWFMGIVMIVLLLGIFVSDWRIWNPRPPVRFAVPEDAEERRAEVVQALANQKLLLPDEIADELKPLFQGLGDSFRGRDRNRIVSHFDCSRMLDELIAQGLFPREMIADRRVILRTMTDALGRGLERQAQLVQWTEFEIRSVKKLDELDAVIIVRHTTDDGSVFLKMRWWVTRRTGSWKVYDMEDLDVSLRFSTVAASVAGMGFGQLQEITRATNHLRDALEAVAAHNADLAEEKLKLLVGLKLPPRLEPLRCMASGVVRLQRGQFKESIEELDEARRLQPDMPALDLLEGIAHNGLGNWENARKNLQAYRDLLGDDPLVCYELGEAFRGVERWGDAAEAYRRSLDLNPKNADAFLGLLNSLPFGEPRDDLADRFTKIENPRLHFEEFADDRKPSRDGESLEQLAMGMKKVDPASTAADYYLALARVWKGQTDLAKGPLRTALAREKDPRSRQDYLLGFMQATLLTENWLEGYNAAPEPHEAFRVLAGELKRTYRQDRLRELLTLHSKNHPNDSLLPFYRAEILLDEDKYELAEKEFAIGLALAPDPATLAEFRGSRVAVRYYTGQGLAAYKEIGPHEETFEQLANLCFLEQNYPLLQTLIDLHAKNSGDTFEILRTRSRLAIKQKQTADGVAVFKAAMVKDVPKERREQFVWQFLRDMADAGHPLQGYEAAPDSLRAFSQLAEYLLETGPRKDLPGLIDAHRKRHPDDVWLLFYTGELHLGERAWEKAANAFGEGFKKEPDDPDDRFRNNFVYAMYRAGRGVQAYRESPADDKLDVFHQLANLMALDKKAPELEALLDARTADNGFEAEILYYRARAKLFAKKLAEALPLFRQACEKQPLDARRRAYVTGFMQDICDAGQPLEGYRAAHDKFAAFETLAARLVSEKKPAELESLLAEHAPGRADDPWTCFYTGELYLLRGDAAKAEPEFASALANAPRDNALMFHSGLNRARIRAGKIAVMYQEGGANSRSFEGLANLCLTEKNPRQLEALIAAHRKLHPDDTNLPLWDLEVVWLRQDFEAVLKLIGEPGQGVFAAPRFRWKTADYIVRSLIKLKRLKEAVQRAEALMKSRQGNVHLLVLAHAADGDVKQAIAALEQHSSQRYLVDDCYYDVDLGPILRSDAFREFRQRFPEPEARRP